MSRTIVIQGTSVDFPEPGTSPDWGQAVEDFAVAVEDALSGVAGAFDVAPQVMNIDAYNPSLSNIDITNLSFSTTNVRAAIINIAVSRQTNTTKETEISVIHVVYNSSNSVGQKWEITREITGDASISFNITDSGQVQFTTTSISGSSHTGILSYSGKALLNS
jgi:hypothetical protein